MKTFIAVLLVGFSVSVFAQSAFFAGGPYDEELPPGANVDYVSWCEGDSIMSENEDGVAVAQWDCSEISESTRCVEQSARKGETTIVSATCQ